MPLESNGILIEKKFYSKANVLEIDFKKLNKKKSLNLNQNQVLY